MTQSTPHQPPAVKQRTRIATNDDVFVFPASFSQQRLWFLEQWEPGVYNTPIAVGVNGRLNISALKRAFAEIVQRHEILRTTFKMEEQTLSQVIALHMPISIPVTDLRPFSKDIQQVKVRRLIKEDFYRHFDLEHGPLIRMSVLQLAEQDAVLLLTMHHSISDGWSMEILFHELAVLYTAYDHNKPSPLPALTLQYADYAVWQREWLQGEVLERQLAYWQRQLADVPVLQLATDHPRPAVQTYRGATRNLFVSASLTVALRNLSRQAGTTLFMTLLAAFQLLLYRYTQQTDIAVGVPIAGRTNSQLEKLIGCFINTLVMRNDLSGNPTVLDLLKRVRQVALEAYDYQDIPFERLVETLPVERDLSHNPLFQVMFALQNVPQGQIDLPDLTLIPLRDDEDFLQKSLGIQTNNRQHFFVPDNKTAMFDLDLTMWESKEEIAGEIKYNVDLFDPETVEQMVQHFLHLLETMVQAPHLPIASIPLLSSAEWQQQIVEWNATEMNYPHDLCMHQLFELQVERTPETPAVIFQHQRLTYRELNEQANNLAYQLRERGAQAETLVAILAERSHLFLTAMLGVFKAGCAYIPLDPYHPASRLLHILKQSGCDFVLVSRSCSSMFYQCLEGLPRSERPMVITLETALQRVFSKANLPSVVTPHHLAYIIYTSGSTGVPKGAMIEHRGMLNHLYAKIEALGITNQDSVAQTASQCFDISVWQFLVALLVGGAVLVYPDEVAHDPTRLLAEVEQHSVSLLETVPSLLRVVVEAYETAPETRSQLKHLRWLIPTGEALPPDVCQRWLSLYPAIPLLNAYGPTECSDDVTHYPIYRMANEYYTSIPIGYPVGNTQLYILDRLMMPVPTGTIGELYVGGDGVGRGYFNDPVRTAAVFLPDPFRRSSSGARLYKTGDLARYKRDGTIEFLGRVDHQVKLRGYRIELGEIETALRQHPVVSECVVLVHERQQGSNQGLVAYISTVQQEKVAPEDVQQFLQERLPEYMVPSAFVFLEALPLTSNGKLDRRALPEPDEVLLASTTPYVAPRTDIEIQLVKIWSQLLGVEKVGVHDDFFLLGGHSLLTIRLMTLIERESGQRLPVTAVFQYRTVEALARLLQQHAASTLWSPGIDLTLPVVDLQTEATLDIAVCPEVWPGEIKTQPGHVFLTGPTGFLGKFLLFELLEQTSATIYCLVRAHDEYEGLQKIQAVLEEAELWRDEWKGRIQSVPGDLARPLLGLSPERFEELMRCIDVIYHNGAAVNMLYPYQELKAANVGGTKEVLRLASHGKVKPLHYVSTLSVLPHTGHTRDQVVSEQDQLDDYRAYVKGGYAQSKWVAEKLVTIARSRGLPTTIYRPGRITGHSQTGVWNPDMLTQMIKSCVQLGKAPFFLSEDTVDMTPVDYISRGIVALSRRRTSLGQAFHFLNPITAPANDLITWIASFGYPVQQVSYEDWYEEISLIAETQPDQNVMSPFVPTFPKKREASTYEIPNVIYDTRNTLTALKGTSISYPPVSEPLLHTYLAYLIKSGYLPHPEASTLSLTQKVLQEEHEKTALLAHITHQYHSAELDSMYAVTTRLTQLEAVNLLNASSNTFDYKKTQAREEDEELKRAMLEKTLLLPSLTADDPRHLTHEMLEPTQRLVPSTLASDLEPQSVGKPARQEDDEDNTPTEPRLPRVTLPTVQAGLEQKQEQPLREEKTPVVSEATQLLPPSKQNRRRLWLFKRGEKPLL